MTERADYLKTLIRYSSKAELRLSTLWFEDIPCSERMCKQKIEIKNAIEYLKKDGKVNIQLKDGEEYVIINMEVV